jgi:hypothetical protein
MYVAPDGRQVAVIAAKGGEPPRLFIRTLDDVHMHEVPGTTNVSSVIWSPDSRNLIFSNTLGSSRIDKGGIPIPISDRVMLGGFWKGDDIYFGSNGRGIERMPAAGGEPVAVTQLQGTEVLHGGPQLLEDGAQILYGTLDKGGRHIFVANLDGTNPRQVAGANDYFAYARGHIIYTRGNATLLAQRFNAQTASLEGEPTTLVEGIYTPNVNSARWRSSTHLATSSRFRRGLPRRHTSWLGSIGTATAWRRCLAAATIPTCRSRPMAATPRCRSWIRTPGRGTSGP